jgi:photosystem II stability/assembly factor-like uncharacterized protein
MAFVGVLPSYTFINGFLFGNTYTAGCNTDWLILEGHHPLDISYKIETLITQLKTKKCMKTLLKKKLTIAFAAGLLFSSVTNAQSKMVEYKQKSNFLSGMKQAQRLNQAQRLGITINPYWADVTAPHTPDTYIFQISVPTATAVWAKVGVDTLGNDTKYFIRSADGGKTWLYDSIQTPQGYVIGSISAIDGNTAYVSMYEPTQTVGMGGGIFKTTNGGATWKQQGVGRIFDESSFPDMVYFFDANHGIAIGDGNGPGTPYMEIYTTDNGGDSWLRVPRENIPPVITGTPYGLKVPNYTVFNNRIWFRGFDSQGANYIYRSDDLGHHWQLFNTTYYNDFAFTDKQNGIGFTADSTGPIINATHDGGATWNEISYTGTQFVFLATIPGTHTYVSSLPGSSYSNDYGATWHIIDSGLTDLHAELAFFNPLVGWNGQAFDTDPAGGMYKWKYQVAIQDNSFNATKTSDNVLLNWNVASDLNSDYYGVERSADGVQFSEIGKVKSTTDLSENHDYDFLDNALLTGQQYYRLRLVNNDGDYSYSKIIKVEFTGARIKLYPNPASDMLQVEGLNLGENTTLSVIDATGRLIEQVRTGDTNYKLDTKKLVAGSYYLKVATDKQVNTLKFVKK